MAKNIKTRTTVKNIKVLDKSVNLSKRMKDAYVRTKDKAEETQNPHHATPTEYASDNIQGTAQGAVRDTAHHISNPRQKASENWNRAKDHFQEVKRQTPKERNRAAEQAQKTAHTTKTNAENLRKTADKAGETAQDAKSAVKDAKNTLKEVRQQGRQTLREVKQKARFEQRGQRDAAPNVTHGAGREDIARERFIKNRQHEIKTRNTANGGLPRPNSGASEIAPKKGGTMPRKATTTAANTPKSGVTRPSYMNKGVQAPKSAGDTAKILQSSAKSTGNAAKSTKNSVKETAKGTVKTAKKSVKTAEKSAQAAVKTAQRTAKTAQKTAQTAAKTAKAAEHAARAAAKAAVKTAKAAAKAVTAMVKAAIAAIKGLVSAIVAGGWVAVLVILIICMIGLIVGSVFGIFFSSEDGASDNGMTMKAVVSQINTEFADELARIISENPHDDYDITSDRAEWKEVLAVYAVKTNTDPDNPLDVATLDDDKVELLREIFWDMNIIDHWVEEIEHTSTSTDADGNTTTDTWYEYILHITVTSKTASEMAEQYGFNDEQKTRLEELLKPEYDDLWRAVLYGSSSGSTDIVEVAISQIGNVGGEPYWSWYGFDSRVAWCACFVSWCANECGYIEAGIIPRFAACQSQGIPWFKAVDLWQDSDSGYTPNPGDIIFFDWEGDGESDHVGIVEYVEDDIVHTVEGNSSDSCRRRSYSIDSSVIVGYGTPAY